jgi:hypothetical protein
MKTTFYLKIALIATFWFCLASCSDKIYQNSWQSTSIRVDGISTDWAHPLRYYDRKSKMQYCISNDADNIYICLRTDDAITKIKMIHAGLVIGIDTNGKFKHQSVIAFPVVHDVKGANPNNINYKSESQANSNENNSIVHSKEMILQGFKGSIEGLTPIKSPCGIFVGMNQDSIKKFIAFEAKIPFNTFYKNSISVIDSSKIIGISITINALPPFFHGANNNAFSIKPSKMEEGLPQNDRRPRPGNPGTGNSGPGENSGPQYTSPSMETNHIKMKIKLAVEKH